MIHTTGLYRRIQLTIILLAMVLTTVGLIAAEITYAQQDERLRELEQRLQRVSDEQMRRTTRIESIERRLEQIDALDLQRRLTRLETISESNRTLLLTITGAVILQMFAAGIGLIRSLARRPP